MCSTREEITEAFASLATALSRVLGLTFDALTTPERLALWSTARPRDASCPASNTR